MKLSRSVVARNAAVIAAGVTSPSILPAPRRG